MNLTILGSGTAVIRTERSATSLLLELKIDSDGEKSLLFDCGWGTGKRLIESGHALNELDHIFITHPHAPLKILPSPPISYRMRTNSNQFAIASLRSKESFFTAAIQDTIRP